VRHIPKKKLGGIILKNLLNYGARIYPVNPKHAEVMGIKSDPSVKAAVEVSKVISTPVDLAIIIRPADEAPGILRELHP
jgi:acyl-CoA synthetase (NDP forming)